MFAILVPATLLPLIITLVWAERRTKQIGIIERTLEDSDVPTSTPSESEPWRLRVKRTIDQLDLVGLTLLGAAVALILLPMTLANRAKDSWSNRACIYALRFGAKVD